MVAAFVDSIVSIAAGQIAGAAKRVETSLAGLLSLAISFLAGFVGLGGVAEKVKAVIAKVQAAVDKALDTAVNWVIGKAKALFAKLFGGKDEKEETDVSKAVKAEVKRELSGATIADAKQADELVTSVYLKYLDKGLKGIRGIFDPKKSQNLVVYAAASATDEVAQLPVTVTGAIKALALFSQFEYDAGPTTLYIYYDKDGKKYGGSPIRNDPDRKGPNHAEDIFVADHLPGLAAKIAQDQRGGLLMTPPGQRIRVELNLNRLPCPTCSPLLARIAGQYPDLQFVVKASSVSNSVTLQKNVPDDFAPVVEMIQAMLDANIEVEPLFIFDEIWNKVMQVVQGVKNGVVHIRTDNLLDHITAKKTFLEVNRAQTLTVRNLIEEAKNRQKLKKIPPHGSTP